MSTDLFLGVIAGVMHVVAFVLYNRQMLKGVSRPNTATWTLWVFLTFLNLGSYRAMSGDWVKSILPLASSTACLFTFIFALAKGKLSKIDPWDGAALGVGIIAGFAWWQYNSATYANLILQGSIAISFAPTLRSIRLDRTSEKPLPWFIWSVAYVLSIVVIVMRWRGQWQDFVYPVNCLMLHAAVGLMADRSRGVTS